jgi:heme a synthase
VGRSQNNPALTVFAVITAISTLFLIWIGGVVTSHGAGMAVPDWPTTFGYNMFAFPFSEWLFTGTGISKEHSHRLVASGVGFLTMILAVWIWIKEERRWLRWLGIIAFVSVCMQGVLGGLRVTLYKDELGIFHATLAQMFFVLVSAIAFFQTKWWKLLVEGNDSWGERGISFHRAFRPVVFVATLFILAQLVLGATMRHQHAGLAVPDFPLAYGKVWPPTDAAFLEEANRARIGSDHRDFAPVTAAQIYLHMTHRLTAAAILLLVGACVLLSRKGEKHPRIARFAIGWFCLILLQASLGAYTIWSNKAADVATAHVAFGALSLLWGSLLFIGTAPLARVSHSEAEFAGRARPPGAPRWASASPTPSISSASSANTEVLGT